jgi:hypothetical protein
MKSQMLYRGTENKKEKPSKWEKVYNVVQAMQRKRLALKKETNS